MKITNDLLSKEDQDGVSVESSPSPHVLNTIQQKLAGIVIHAPEGRSLEGAKAGFLAPSTGKQGIKRSVHLVVSDDGSRVVQHVPFNKVANHAFGYNSITLGIELVYVGRLRRDETRSGFHLRKWFKEDFQGNQYIYASALNDSQFQYWPLFPKAQLDALYDIAKVLKEKYGLTDVFGYEELNPVVHPGPAFPLTQFREKLFGVTDRSIILQKTSKDVLLLGEPGKERTALLETVVPAGRPVTIINEMTVTKKGGWYLISVVDTKEGSPWLIGWVPADAVKVNTDFQLTVNNENYLTTKEGRRFQEIKPHPNGYDAKRTMPDPKYIIMHFTTGTKMESTISHFKNPSAGVSTHLLVGRDGRVVQFLPFDRIAHHTGFSWWEQESNLNTSSIGIELDNAGLLRKNKDGKWFRRRVEIPPENVVQAVHWKQFAPSKEERYPGWEVFPQVQLAVARKIVEAIKKKYPSIQEILGHDDVNLRNRYDPGPLFPMQDFRNKLFGREEPKIRIYEIAQETELYGNFKGRLPNTKQRLFDVMLPAGSLVNVMIEEDDFSLVVVLKSKEPKLKGIGWIQTSSLESMADRGKKGGKKQEGGKKGNDKRRTIISQPIYRQGESAPTPVLGDGPFKAGTKVRVQQVRGAWTLVVVLVSEEDRKEKRLRGGLEGWLPTELLTPNPGS